MRRVSGSGGADNAPLAYVRHSLVRCACSHVLRTQLAVLANQQLPYRKMFVHVHAHQLIDVRRTQGVSPSPPRLKSVATWRTEKVQLLTVGTKTCEQGVEGSVVGT